MFVCAECGQRYERGGYCATDGQALGETDDPLLGTEVGRYRLARLIGEGGMGRVYLAVQPVIGSRVAVKILAADCARNPGLLERFFAEARAVNLIRHENIVSVLDMAQLPDGRPFIVMEFIEGQTLAEIIRPARPPIGGVVHVMAEVLSALGAAHAIGIVHRDLKPDNILITGEGHAKVLDFGIAKLAPGLQGALSPRTATGALLGTPAYMAPEQISGSGNIDARTDLYAAGIVLYEAVTGATPFSGGTLYELMRAHLELPPPPPRSLRSELPPPLEQVILTALAKQPEHRFQTAGAMAQALHQASGSLAADEWRPLSTRSRMLTGRPVTTPSGQPTPALPAIAATASRGSRRWIGWIVGVLVAVALAGGITVLWIGHDIRSTGTAEPAEPAAPAVAPAPRIAIAPAPPPPAPVSPPRHVATAGSGGPIIIGGGSAADHGVIISGNVQIGPGVVIGQAGVSPPTATTFTRPADYDPKRFDATAYLATARALAVGVFPDAKLVRFDIAGVYPDGHADLTLPDLDTSSYQFRSPAHSARTSNLPANVRDEIACYVEVTVHPREVEVRVRDMDPIDVNCRAPLRPTPACSLAGVWKHGQASGAKPNTVAKISYLHDGWFFANQFDGEGIDESIPDQCP